MRHPCFVSNTFHCEVAVVGLAVPNMRRSGAASRHPCADAVRSSVSPRGAWDALPADHLSAVSNHRRDLSCVGGVVQRASRMLVRSPRKTTSTPPSETLERPDGGLHGSTDTPRSCFSAQLIPRMFGTARPHHHGPSQDHTQSNTGPTNHPHREPLKTPHLWHCYSGKPLARK